MSEGWEQKDYSDTTIIVGAGLAGLSCGVQLHNAGKKCLILEKSGSPGGRVKTDKVNGFLLDHGFQVFLSAYPEAGEFLDLEALDLKPFSPGAIVIKENRRTRLMDVFRRPQWAISSALAPIGSLKDKLLVAKLRLHVSRLSIPEIWQSENTSTESFLRNFGFSSSMIDGFFRSFYGGIFLESKLDTSSRMFLFTFKMFSSGFATVPANGMQAIPDQLADRLPPDTVITGCEVTGIRKGEVTLAQGQTLKPESVVVATEGDSAWSLLGLSNKPAITWQSTVCVYFSAPASPLNEAIIALNGDTTNQGIVNNVAVMSDVSNAYAPPGQALIAASILGQPDIPEPHTTVQNELISWFGDQVHQWSHLKTYSIPHSLPSTSPAPSPQNPIRRHDDSVIICGDHCTSASIEGAILSGTSAANSIVNP